MKKNVVFGAIVMAIAIAFGALGAHAIRKMIDSESLVIYKTGVEYQILHAFGLILSGIVFDEVKPRKVIGWLFGLGMLFFSGTVYFFGFRAYLSDSFLKVIGPITPIGGTLFIIGWLYFAWQYYKMKKSSTSEQ